MTRPLLSCRAPKSLEIGSRSELPTLIEVEALKRGGSVRIKVYFSDKKFLFCRVDSWTTFQDLHAAVCKSLHLHRESEELFSLFEVDGRMISDRVPGPEERVLDAVARWEKLITADPLSSSG